MRNFKRLFQPKSLAVIGGGAWGEAVLTQAQKFGFEGKIYPVHPVKKEIAGLKAYPSAVQLPEAPDATFVGINREASIGAVERLRKKGAGGAVCFASGYAEANREDATGADAQERLLRAAGDMPILGPNCYGFINALDGVAVWPDQHGCRRVDRGVAILTQSSNIAINMTMQTRGLPIAMMVTAGNQAQTDQAEIAEALLEDDRITAIGVHIEGFGNIRNWERFAAKARAKGVPLIALKIGKSSQARQATISHTASLAGADAAAQALLERLGIRRANTIPTFLETLKLLHLIGPLPSGDIASISCSGGEASLVADMAQNRGLSFPTLTVGQKQSLFDSLGPKVALANPLDYHTYIWRDEDAMTRAWSAMAGPDIAITLIVLDYPRADICDPSDWTCATNAAIRMRRDTGRPVAVVSSLPELMPEAVAQELIAGGVVPFGGLYEGLAAVSLAAHKFKTTDDEPVFLATPVEPQVLTEAQAKARLQEFDIAVPRSIRTDKNCKSTEDLSFPVVVKTEGVSHKSDQGGVILDCQDIDAVRAAIASMPPAPAYLVEEMVPAGHELLVGIVHDPAHGYLLTIGAGGVTTEIVKDSVSLLVPVSRETIEQALNRLKMGPLLKGYRRREGADLEAIVDTVVKLQDLVMRSDPPLTEAEINPLICTPSGAIAVDALIRGPK